MNSSELANELSDLTYYVLEPHAAYIHGTDDEHILYYIPPEVLIALAWLGTNIAVPILTGLAQSTISEKLKKWKEENDLKALKLEKRIEELEKLKRELEATLEQLNKTRIPSESEILTARASLAEVLKINGWPADLAEKDSEKVILTISNQLWRPEN